MFRKTITYEDYDGKVRTEDHYFNISRAELALMELGTEGGYTAYLDKISKEQDTVKIAEIFKEIIHKSYGVKSSDGKRFIKNEEIVTAFEQSEAYSELIIWLLQADNASLFMKAILPANLVAAAEAQQESNPNDRIVKLPPNG